MRSFRWVVRELLHSLERGQALCTRAIHLVTTKHEDRMEQKLGEKDAGKKKYNRNEQKKMISGYFFKQKNTHVHTD